MRAIQLIGLITGLSFFAAPLAQAQVSFAKDVQSVNSHDISATGLTIYPDNLALVRETRTVDLPAGTVNIRFFGVSDMIIPQSAVLESFEGLRLEGNFDSDLITPAKLLERSVGEAVIIRRVNPITGTSELVRAELISAAPEGNRSQAIAAIFKTSDGVEGYQCSGLAEALLLNNLPDDLHSVPVLSTRVVTETAGSKDITLTYMTRGLGWSADYRMDVEAGIDEVGILGWLTLKNETSKSFKETELSVVAGELNQVTHRNASSHGSTWDRGANCVLHRNVAVTAIFGEPPPPMMAMAPVVEFSPGFSEEDTIIVTASKRAKVREAKQEDLGDYKLYRAPQAVSVEPYQTKQIAFLSKHNVALKQGKRHRWNIGEAENQGEDTPIYGRLVYELDNSKSGNLAVPLPAGTVRAMSQTEDGLNIFIGEDDIANTAVGLPVELEIADSFLVTAQFHVLDEGDGKAEARVDVTNATKEKIIAEFDFDYLEDIKIRRDGKRKSLSENGKVYTLSVPAEQTVTFTFKAKYE